jgi:TRAP-type C4-dicarboxylate transport system substrate-binding protein
LGDSVKIETVPSDTVTLIRLKEGVVDIAPLSTIFLVRSNNPGMSLFDLPFFFGNLVEVSALEESPIGDVILGTLAQNGLIGLAYLNAGPRSAGTPC